MSEQNPEQPAHQDPAEPKEVGTETETSEQADPEPVEVSPVDPAAKTDNLHGVDYEVTPERGYRRVEARS